MQDVTKLVGASDEFRSTDEGLRAVLDGVPTAIAISDDDGHSVWRNRAYRDLLGYSDDELEQLLLEEMVIPADRRLVLELRARVDAGEIDSTSARPVTVQRPDGTSIQLSVSVTRTMAAEVPVRVVSLRDVSGQANAEHQLAEEEARFRNVFESASGGLLIIGPDGVPQRANPALLELFGTSFEELARRTPSGFVASEQQGTDLSSCIAGHLDGDEGSCEQTLEIERESDGERRSLEVTCQSLMVGDEARGVLAEYTDVTQEQTLEQQVQETADRLNMVFETASTGLAVWGADRRPQTINQAFSEITGYSLEELLDGPFDRLLHPADLEMTLGRFKRRIAGEEIVPHRINVRAIRKDGREIVVELRAEPFAVGGEITGVLTEIRDVTEQLELQALVTESADQISTILEATPDAIVVADDHAVILRVNAATELIFGAAPDELIGQAVSVLVGGIDGAAHSTYVEHYRRTGEASTDEGLVIGNFREAVGRRFDGSEFPAELAVAETELKDGRQLFVAAIRDITARRLAEEELQRLNTELEERSHERQALVQQLLSAQEDERQTVAYDIHDGPAQQLAAAQMFLEAYAFDQNIDVESDGSAGHLQRAMTYLTSGLADTRRIMSGLRPALIDDVGLSDALRELLREMTERAGIQFELHTNKLRDPLSASAEITLYRVAQEAAGNALKHSGAETLSVTLGSEDSMVRLQVSDDGSGFDSSAVEGPRDGHHYGLVGMRERVELLGGHFQIDSAPGLGTVVTATIPVGVTPS